MRMSRLCVEIFFNTQFAIVLRRFGLRFIMRAIGI